jgi:hypothetical protein
MQALLDRYDKKSYKGLAIIQKILRDEKFDVHSHKNWIWYYCIQNDRIENLDTMLNLPVLKPRFLFFAICHTYHIQNKRAMQTLIRSMKFTNMFKFLFQIHPSHPENQKCIQVMLSKTDPFNFEKTPIFSSMVSYLWPTLDFLGQWFRDGAYPEYKFMAADVSEILIVFSELVFGGFDIMKHEMFNTSSAGRSCIRFNRFGK